MGRNHKFRYLRGLVYATRGVCSNLLLPTTRDVRREVAITLLEMDIRNTGGIAPWDPML